MKTHSKSIWTNTTWHKPNHSLTFEIVSIMLQRTKEQGVVLCNLVYFWHLMQVYWHTNWCCSFLNIKKDFDTRLFLENRKGRRHGGGGTISPLRFQKREKLENTGHFHALELLEFAFLSSLTRKYMLWEGFYLDFSTWKASASGGKPLDPCQGGAEPPRPPDPHAPSNNLPWDPWEQVVLALSIYWQWVYQIMEGDSGSLKIKLTKDIEDGAAVFNSWVTWAMVSFLSIHLYTKS